MIPKRITVEATEVGDWIPLNRRSRDNVGITVSPHATAAGTFTVNYTQSAVNRKGTKAAFSRTTTVLTITFPNHGLSVADDVFIVGSADYSGQFIVASVVDVNTFTVTVTDSGQTDVSGFVQPVIVSILTGFSAVTGQTDGQIDASVMAIRLNCTNSTTAPHDLLINQY